MSSYVISDIHGNSNVFELLKKAKVSFPEDVLYVSGDIVDRGKDPLEVFKKFLKMQSEYPDNIVILLGNHELFLKMYLEGKLSEKEYRAFGGTNTIKKLKDYYPDDVSRKALVDYIDSMPVYVNVFSPVFGDTVITHTGLDADHICFGPDKIDVATSIMAAYLSDSYNYMVGCDLQKGYLPAAVLNNLDKFMIVGHVPTIHIEKTKTVIIKEHYMDIDTGSSYFGGKLSLYRIDDGKVFQVKG
ncbi:MAG: metallophosphoesterase [Erysipelotrichaceae bacterium]|nr:metallophosphoesterase [Erysipelotrichaceae bacterium]